MFTIIAMNFVQGQLIIAYKNIVKRFIKLENSLHFRKSTSPNYAQSFQQSHRSELFRITK